MSGSSVPENGFAVSANQSKAISVLVQLLKNNGDKILDGSTKLSLTSSILNLINDGFMYIGDDDTERSFNVQSSTNFQDGIYHDLMFLHDFVQKTVGLKITHGITTLQNNVNIARFHSLKILEIKKIPIHMIHGLKGLHCQLTTIICCRCLNKLQTLFQIPNLNETDTRPWLSLNAAILSYNNIDELDHSLSLIPYIEVLDISHNNIHHTEYIEYLEKLKCLNMSYNHLETVPKLSVATYSKLRVLNLRNNNLEDLEGLEHFNCLEEIDVGYNCIIQHSQLKPLRYLQFLKAIWLDGNPIFYHDKHRLLTLSNLHTEVVIPQFRLDNSLLTQKELLYAKGLQAVRRYPVGLTSSGDYDSRSAYENSYQSRGEGSVGSGISNEEIEDLNCSINSTTSSVRRKRHRVREVKLEEDRPQTNGQSEAVSEHLQTKEKVERFRKDLGTSWMVASTRLRSSETDSKFMGGAPLPRVSTSLNNDFEISSKVEADDKFNEDIVSRDEAAENENIDDVVDAVALINVNNSIAINSVAECIDITEKISSCYAKSISSSPSDFSSDKSDGEDMDIDEQMFVADFHCGKKVATLFLSIQGYNLRERDINKGRTLERLDIRSLLSMEKVNSSGIHLKFDYIRKDRKERLYVFNDIDDYKQFWNLIEPILQEKLMEEFKKGALQCLSCHAQFSKGVANLKLHSSKVPQDGVIKQHDNSKEYLREISTCPNCSSKMIIELDDAPLPSNDYSSKIDTASANTFLNSVNQKTPPPPQINRENSIPKQLDEILEANYDHKQHSTSLPSTPVQKIGSRLMENQLHRGKKEVENRNLLFASGYPSSHKSRSLESSPPSTSPPVDKFDCEFYVHDDVREESIVKIREETPEKQHLVYGTHIECLTSTPIRRQSECLHQTIDNEKKTERRLSTPLVEPVMKRSESDVTIISDPSQSSISVLSTPTYDHGETPNLETNTESKKLSSYLISCSHNDSNCSSSGSVASSVTTAIEGHLYDGRLSEARSSSSSNMQTKSEFLGDTLYETVVDVPSVDSSLTFHSCDRENILDNSSDSQSEGVSTEFIAAEENVFNSLTSTEDIVQSHSVKYNYENYSQIDHKIRLFLDMNLLAAGEDFQLIVKASIVGQKLNDCAGLVIISTKNVYVMKITGDESNEPAKWLQKVFVKPISQVKILKAYLGNQGFIFEFDAPNSSSYLFLLRDSDRCAKFIKQVENLHLDMLTVVRDDENTFLPAIHATVNDVCEKSECGFQTEIELYILGFFINVFKEKSNLDPVSIVVTKTCVHILNENHSLNLTRSKNDSSKLLQSLHHQIISDLTSVTILEDQTQAKLSFFNEDSEEEFEWHIAMETERSLQSLIGALKEPWKKLFSVDLSIINFKP